MSLTISIVMATYNGEKFIAEQLNSIVPYLSDQDELIVSDDGSEDSTRAIVEDTIRTHPIVKLIDGPQKGVVKNFENALYAASKDIICRSRRCLDAK